MYRRNNRLGLLALVVVVIALVAIFNGRDRGEFRPRVVPPAPPAVVAPGAPFGAQVEPGQRWDERQWRADQARRWAEREEWRQRWAEREEWRRYGHGPFWFGPLFVIGKLIKLLLALGLIGAGIALIRRDRRRRWRGPDGPGEGGPGTPIGPVFHV